DLAGPRRLGSGDGAAALADHPVPGRHWHRRGGFRECRRRLRLLPGLESLTARSHRSAPLQLSVRERRRLIKLRRYRFHKVGRVACPWLIKKFIDPQVEFLSVPPTARTPGQQV